MEFPVVLVFFPGKSVKDIRAVFERMGFIVENPNHSGDTLYVRDRTSPMGMTTRPLWYICHAQPGGTRVQHIVGSERERDRSRAFLQALADGREADVPELLGAMRLTPFTP